MTKARLLLLIVVALMIFFISEFNQYLDFNYLKSQQQQLEQYVDNQPIMAAVVFFSFYVLIAALSLPGAALLTLLAGAIFGFWQGLIIVSFASSIGATLAFLVARFLLRDWVQQKFNKALRSINQGMENEGHYYLFGLRLIPAFPFFLVNLAMGLTSIKVMTFYWVSQVGMLAGTMVYVNAGTQLALLESASDILSLPVIAAFTLLGVFPFFVKKLLSFLAIKRLYKPWVKPKHFDNNLIVIGAGAGGLVSAYIAAAVKAKVTLIEKSLMGGDCLNTGCVPSKALIRSSRLMHQIKHSDRWAIQGEASACDMQLVMRRVNEVINRIAPHDSIERYSDLGVNVLSGEAEIISPFTVKVNDEFISAKNIIVATGARPFVPLIPGLKKVNYLTSETVWGLDKLPENLVVLGGGAIGCELAQAFSRLGSRVVQIEMQPRLLIREDEEVSAAVEDRFTQEGVKVYTSATAKEVIVTGDEKTLLVEKNGDLLRLAFDEILIAVGRQANTEGCGLERLGVKLNENGTIAVNQNQQTNYPNILAVGDVAGPYQLTHVAAHQAWYASVNALFGVIKKFKTDYAVIPTATFIDPEVARVGINESEAIASGISYQVSRYNINDLDRAIADGNDFGFIKVLTVPGKDTILGVTVVGANAGEIIAEYVLPMKHGLGLNKVLGTIHVYPTMMEANKFVAGQWKQANTSKKLLELLQRWHQWRRGE